MKGLLTILTILVSITLHGQSGISWGPVMDVAPGTYDNNHPRIMLDAAGDPMVLWANSNLETAHFRLWNGSAFADAVMPYPVTMSASWFGPEMISRNDTVYVVFHECCFGSGHIYLTRSFDAGQNWDPYVRVDYIGDSLAEFPSVGIDKFGHPLVAFMKSDTNYTTTDWVMLRSADYGQTFLPGAVTSSASSSTVCDCCPSSIVSEGDDVAFLYRGNISNMRDNWLALSGDNGMSFPNGMNIDQHNWMLMSCPSSGPDGVIVGDTLYSVMMNGSGGTRVYTNKNHLGTFTSGAAVPVTGPITGLTYQNYPRIANSGTAVAQVWRQVISGTTQLALLFTENIHTGFPPAFDTIASGVSNSIVTVDVAVSSDAVHVVWQNDAAGVVKYRKGFFGPAGIKEEANQTGIRTFPNPANGRLRIDYTPKEKAQLFVYSIAGNEILKMDLQPQEELILNTESFVPGAYFFSIEEKGHKRKGRFIVLR